MPQDIESTSTMTKADLVRVVYENIGFSKKEASDLVECVLEIMKSSLENGEKVKVSGFGSFLVREKEPRRGRNPQTDQSIIISGRKVLIFKASPVLKTCLNESLG
jgi:integration host factor subunit alpha